MSGFKIVSDWAISKGERTVQEDVVQLWLNDSQTAGYMIVADGMGGHTFGDIAASIAVEAADLYLQKNWKALEAKPRKIPKLLPEILNTANSRIQNFTDKDPKTSGMGTTLVSALIVDSCLYWASVGDSTLFILRDGVMTRLNEDHSMARQIDQMVEVGQLTQSDAKAHPNRAALTSVLMGGDIAAIDCSKQAVRLKKDDVILTTSDGVLTIDTDTLRQAVNNAGKNVSDIARAIKEKVLKQNDPSQDNLAICVSLIL